MRTKKQLETNVKTGKLYMLSKDNDLKESNPNHLSDEGRKLSKGILHGYLLRRRLHKQKEYLKDKRIMSEAQMVFGLQDC